MNKIKTEQEKMEFIEQINGLCHKLLGLFTPFTLLPGYLPQSEVMPDEQRVEILGTISQIQNWQSRFNLLLQSYFENKSVKKIKEFQEKLVQSFNDFYAAAQDFLKKKQPQKAAGNVADGILETVFELQAYLEEILELKAKKATDTIREMSRLVQNFQASKKK